MTQMAENSFKVLQRRYLLRDVNGSVIETPDELFRRVAKTVASVEMDEIYWSAWKQKALPSFGTIPKVYRYCNRAWKITAGAAKYVCKSFGKFFWLQEC